MYLQHIPETDQFIFLDAGKPYRMIGSPMLFSSLREAVEAAEFCGFSVLADGRVINQPTPHKTGPNGLSATSF